MSGRFLPGSTLALALAAAGTASSAHEFTAAILAVGADRETQLAEAVNGFLLAADERDGHTGETSDGHLGGVDVHVLPLPHEAAVQVEGLSGAPEEPPGVVVLIGPDRETAAAMAGLETESIVLRPGMLPAAWSEADKPESFAARYRRAYGATPSQAAAEGYNAARRLDFAIRPLDGLVPRVEIEAALAATESGIEW